MGDYNELVSICKHLLFERFAPAPAYIRGLLGDGQGNVLVPDRPDYNYARFNRSSTDVFEIFNKEVSQPIDNLPILIGEYPWQPGLTQVVGIDWATYNQIGWGNTYANLQAHASTHEWPDLAPGSDYTRTFLRSIVPLQGYGAGSGTSYNFYAQPYEYDYTGTSQYWPGLPPVSLAGALPATGTMRYMGVYLNPATNQLGAVSGSAVAYVDNSEPPRPKFPLNVYPVAYARLYGGQQFIAERDTRDARRLWNNTLVFTGTSSGGGGGGWPFEHVLTVSATDPNADYTTIGAAITAASAGDVIFVDAATYAESLVVNKAITIFALNVTVTGSVSISAAATVIYLTTTQTAANARGFVCSGGVEMNLLDCKAVPNGSTTSWAIEASGMDTIVNVRGGYYEETGAGTRVSISVGADVLVIMDDPIIVNPVFVETGLLRGQYLDQGGNAYTHGQHIYDNLSAMSSGVWLESSGSTRLRTHYFVSGSPSAALLAAIAALTDGDTITCSNGSYSVEATIAANNVTIEGIGEVTITSAVNNTITLTVTGNDVKFRNLIINHTGAGSTGYPVAFNGNNFTLENCTLTKSGAPSLGAGLYQYGGTGAKALNTFVTESGATNGYGYYNTIAAGAMEFYGGKLSGSDYDIWGDVSGSTLALYDTVLVNNLISYDGTISHVYNAPGVGIILPASGDDIFIENNGAGLFTRSPNTWIVPTDHFNDISNSGVTLTTRDGTFTWAAYGVYDSEPSTVNGSDFPDVLRLNNDNTTDDHFAFQSVAGDTTINCRLSKGPSSYVGVRVDDGTDNNFVEFRLVDSVTYADQFRLESRVRTGGGAVTSANYVDPLPPAQWYILQLFFSATSDLAQIFIGVDSPMTKFIVNLSGHTWNPANGGFTFGQRASTAASRAGLYDFIRVD